MTDRAPLHAWRSTAEEAAGNLGLALHLARKATGLSLRALSELAGVRADVLQRTERGTWVPTADEVDRVLDALVSAREAEATASAATRSDEP